MALAAEMGLWSCPLAEPDQPCWLGGFRAGGSAEAGLGEDVGLWWSRARAKVGNEASPSAQGGLGLS